MAQTQKLSSLNGSEIIAQQGDFTCNFNFKVDNLYITYAYDHQEKYFWNVIVAPGLSESLRAAALLVDACASGLGSVAEGLAGINADYEIGFITSAERDSRVKDLLWPESTSAWDDAIRIWSSKKSAISIGVAQAKEFMSLLPAEVLSKLMLDLTQKLLER